MTTQAARDGDQHAAGVAAFMEESDRLMASLPGLVDDTMKELSQAFKAPVAGVTFPPAVWGAVWADVGDERLAELLANDHATLYGLLRAIWRRQLDQEEHSA